MILKHREAKSHEISHVGRIKSLSSGSKATLPLNHNKIGPKFQNLSFKVGKEEKSVIEKQQAQGYLGSSGNTEVGWESQWGQ